MELHIRFQVPRGEEDIAVRLGRAERQDFPADAAALGAAGFLPVSPGEAAAGEAVTPRAALLLRGQKALAAHLKA
eukprot:9623551-Alexandrium_andersonii.AAC.1